MACEDAFSLDDDSSHEPGCDTLNRESNPHGDDAFALDESDDDAAPPVPLDIEKDTTFAMLVLLSICSKRQYLMSVVLFHPHLWVASAA
jgi:hypothetical protein